MHAILAKRPRSHDVSEYLTRAGQLPAGRRGKKKEERKEGIEQKASLWVKELSNDFSSGPALGKQNLEFQLCHIRRVFH